TPRRARRRVTVRTLLVLASLSSAASAVPVGTGLLAVAGAAAAAPKRPTPRAPAAPRRPPPAARVDVRIVEGGQMAQVQVEGGHMRVRSTAGRTAFERDLDGDERDKLSEAARTALAADDVRRSCGSGGETFVTVTVDDKTLFNAVCESSSDAVAGPWRRLI